MTAAEASIVVQEEADKKTAQNTESSAEKGPVTGSTKKEEKDAKAESTEDKPADSNSGGQKTTEPDGSEEKKEDTKEDSESAKKEPEDPGAEAALCLVQGKRNILVQDYAMAVECLQRACELLAAKYGDDASECAEALHYYGKALLELHRKASGALNDMPTQEGAEEDSSDDENDEEEEGGEAKEQGTDKDNKEGESSSGDDKAEEGGAGDQPKDEEDLEAENGAGAANKETQEAVGDEEEVSNLQIAFEVLDLAKKIYKRDAEKDPQLYLKAADCLLSLGEIGLESDTYDRAIDDFEECLRIQQEMLPRDARVMAETNYQLGLTYSFVNKFEQSAAFFGDALQILELKIANLKKAIEDEKAKGEKSASTENDVVRRTEEEIKDIQQILPEIAAKMEDAKEMQRDSARGPKEKIIEEMMNRIPETSPVKKETKVNVISSSLIKRKRHLADDTEAGGSAALTENAEKKVKEN